MNQSKVRFGPNIETKIQIRIEYSNMNPDLQANLALNQSRPGASQSI